MKNRKGLSLISIILIIVALVFVVGGGIFLFFAKYDAIMNTNAKVGSLVQISRSGNTRTFIDAYSKVYKYEGYEELSSFRDSVAIARKNSKYALINTREKQLVKYDEYQNIENTYIDGLYIVTKNGKKGVIDQTGEIVIPLNYDDLVTFVSDDKILEYTVNGKKGILGIDGTSIFESTANTDFYVDNLNYFLNKDDDEESILRAVADGSGKYYIYNVVSNKKLLEIASDDIINDVVNTNNVILDIKAKKAYVYDQSGESKNTYELVKNLYNGFGEYTLIETDSEYIVVDKNGTEVVKTASKPLIFRNSDLRTVVAVSHDKKVDLYFESKLEKTIENVDFADIYFDADSSYKYTPIINSMCIALKTEENTTDLYNLKFDNIATDVKISESDFRNSKKFRSYIVLENAESTEKTILTQNKKQYKISPNSYVMENYLQDVSDFIMINTSAISKDKAITVINLNGNEIRYFNDDNLENMIDLGNGRLLAREASSSFVYDLNIKREVFRFNTSRYRNYNLDYNYLILDTGFYSFSGKLLEIIATDVVDIEDDTGVEAEE